MKKNIYLKGNLKKFLLLFMVFSVILALVFIFPNVKSKIVHALPADYGWYGDGQSDVFEIGTAGELLGFANLVNGEYETADFFIEKTVKLTANIDLSVYGENSDFNSGKGWVPIGSDERHAFEGIFDGDGFGITDLYIRDSNLGYAGLFGYIQNSTIQNLSVDVDISEVDFYIGGIVGYFENSNISNCRLSGDIVCNDSYAGGIAGIGITGDVSNCYSTVNVSGSQELGGIAGKVSGCNITDSYSGGGISGYSVIGGIAGTISAESTFESHVERCYSTGSIVCTGDAAGGIVGYAEDSRITDSHSESAVSAEDGYAGGIAGSAFNSEVSGCYSIGNISGTHGVVGGIVGGSARDCNISQCYSTGIIAGSHSIGGIVGYAEYMDISECYSTGSVMGETIDDSGVDASLIGGIAGEIYYANLLNCYTTGNVSGKSDIGGIAGATYETLISGCYSTGLILGERSSIGGILGNTVYLTVISDSVALNSQVSGNSRTGRVLGNAFEPEDITLVNNYAYAGMIDKNETTDWENKSTDGKDGEDIADPILPSSAFWINYAGWSEEIWVFEDGELPRLRAFKFERKNELTIADWIYGNPSNPDVGTVMESATVTYYYDTAENGEFISTTKPLDAGTYYVKAVIAESENYKEWTAMAEFTISKATLNITGITGTAVYNETLADVDLSGEESFDGTFSWEQAENTKVGSAGTVTVFTLKFTPSDSANYNEVINISVTITVSKITLTVRAADKTRSYGESNPDLTYNNIAGFVNGESESVITGAFNLSTTATQLSPAGDYPINVSIGTVQAANYDFTFINGTLTIEKANYNINSVTFDDRTETYTGSVYTIEISGMPSWMSVSYSPSNSRTDAGTYVITATFTDTEGNHNLSAETKTATLTIEKAAYTNITHDALSAVYTDTNTLADVTGLQLGYSWVMPSTKLTAAQSSYAAKYNADPENYIDFELYITVSVAKADFDMSGVTFTSKTANYNGSPIGIALSGTLPGGISVTYSDNIGSAGASYSKTNAGTYEVTAAFSHNNSNYNEISSMQATLTIEKANYNINSITFANKTETYTGSVYTIEVSGMPSWMSVSYSPSNSRTDAGTYVITATFADTEGNHNLSAETKTATLTIEKADYDMSGVKFENKNVTYDGSSHSIEIEGALPVGVEIGGYENNDQTERGIYTVTVTFISINPNYNTPANMDATLTINDKLIRDNVLVIMDWTYGNTGTPNVGIIGDGAEVIYYYDVSETGEFTSTEQPTNAGTYYVIAKIAESENYNAYETEAVQFIIAKANYDMSGVKFKNIKITYDGKSHSIEIEGTLPEGVEIDGYENNGQTKAGEYTVTVRFRSTNPNYNAPAEMKAALTIEDASKPNSFPWWIVVVVGIVLLAMLVSIVVGKKSTK